MKIKLIALLIILAAILAPITGTNKVTALAQAQQQPKTASPMTAEQSRALMTYGADVNIELDEQQIPSFLMGPISDRASSDLEKAALAALDQHGAAFRRRPDDGFLHRLTFKDPVGTSHVRMSQTYKGIPVIGGELIVHLSEKKVLGINGHFVADLDLSTTPVINSDQAAAAALAFVAKQGGGSASVTQVGKAVVFVTDNNDGRLAIPVRVEYVDADGPQRGDLFVDAENGPVLGLNPLIMRSKFRQIWDSGQVCQNPPAFGTFLFHEGIDSPNNVATAAYNNVGTAYDYYSAVFSRDSFDGAGDIINAVINTVFLTPFGCDRDNALWDVQRRSLFFGVGDDVIARNYAYGLDIVAHEFTHGVTQFEANLNYNGESGALNEATSDILGESAAFWAGQGDWLIGTGVYLNGPLRYMNNPTLDGVSRDYYPERFTGGGDNGGVHFNSGIGNLFFYLLSQGGSHPRGRTSVTVPAIGRDKAQRIWYQALAAYMTATTNFAGARSATGQAAAAFYGNCSPEYVSVQQAWDAVGVPGGWSCFTCDPDGSKRQRCFAMGGIHFDADSCVCCTSTQITDCFVID